MEWLRHVTKIPRAESLGTIPAENIRAKKIWGHIPLCLHSHCTISISISSILNMKLESKISTVPWYFHVFLHFQRGKRILLRILKEFTIVELILFHVICMHDITMMFGLRAWLIPRSGIRNYRLSQYIVWTNCAQHNYASTKTLRGIDNLMLFCKEHSQIAIMPITYDEDHVYVTDRW